MFNFQKSVKVYLYCSLFVCLFVFWSLSSHSIIFHSYGDVIIAGEWLQILTFARHSWLLSSEVSLTGLTHCDTGLPFIMVISEDPWHSYLLPSVWHWRCHYLFLRLRPVATGDRTPISRVRGGTLRHRGGLFVLYNFHFHESYYFQLFSLFFSFVQQCIIYRIWNEVDKYDALQKRNLNI